MICFRVLAWKMWCWGRIGDKISRKEVKKLKVQVLKEWPMRILALPKYGKNKLERQWASKNLQEVIESDLVLANHWNEEPYAWYTLETLRLNTDCS